MPSAVFPSQRHWPGRPLSAGLSLALALAAGSAGAAPLTQPELDRAARELKVGFAVLENGVTGDCGSGEGGCYRGELSLTAPHGLPPDGWALFFSHVERMRRVDDPRFRVEHVNGDLYRLTPAPGSAGLKPGETYRIGFRGGGSHLSAYYPMPNHYLAAEGLKARVIESTRPIVDPETGLEGLPFVAPFVDEAKLERRSPGDRTVWATPARTYAANAATPTALGAGPPVIPSPREVRAGTGALDLSGGLVVRLEGFDRKDLAPALAAAGETGRGAPLVVRRASKPLPLGGYGLAIDAEGVVIEASDAEGASNGLRTLAALRAAGPTVPQLAIEDAPRFGFRGLHLDVARNFHGKALVLAVLEQMAAYKLNRLHLHLGDDEGWRLEIAGLPELTEIGARRCHDLAEDRCLLPQLGAGPDGDTPVDGFYSAADYIEIVRAAAARHIEVIPSFDMPGHSRAAIRAMDARARRLRAAGDEAGAARYLLSEAADRSVYDSIQHYRDNTINVCQESAYAFVAKVVDEVAALHVRAGRPLKTYHIGADETPGAWIGSPACAALSKTTGVPVKKLGGYFIERVSARLAERGIVAAGWSDGMGDADARKMPAAVQSNLWAPLFGGATAVGRKQAGQGWRVVVSVPEATYLDAPNAVDPYERGYDWMSRFTDSRKLFDFMPESLPVHAEIWTDLENRPATVTDNGGRGARFDGVQAQLWSETIRSDDQVEYMLFPRLLAFAERAWRRADWEPTPASDGGPYGPQTQTFSAAARVARDREWAGFAARVGTVELRRLDQAGIAYRIPIVGAVVESGVLKANLEVPGLPIEYRVAGGGWVPYAGPAPVEGAVEIRARSADGRRAGRTVTVGERR
ncbi:N-acetyl-beta-hexosaminidase [Caulobacter mirabilis]|uniref:beta-N-acetylhexosaminidase n=1 Tax=Caulobacter mirabilis TaxID=69666 RepID=A0A2D2B4E7_9CAUL|nr:N-acetyl-beta-hexosaminidase [Caulobacter mirabilis]